MCCESSSPYIDDKVDMDVLLKCIDSIEDIKSIRLITITGGEPFLYPDDVLAVAERCKKIGRKFGVITNAFWCKSYSHTFDVISKLKENSLIRCFVSVDAFHQEYIPIEHVKTFLRVCKDLTIPIEIQASLTKSTFERTDEVISKLGIDKLYTRILFGSAYPVGAAKEQLDQKEFFTRKLDSTLCQYQSILHVTPTGQIRPCCSPCFTGIPFDFGNIYTDSLKDILKKVSENELMRMIANEGFSKLIQEATKELGFIELEEYVDDCHLCNHLLADTDRYIYLQKKVKEWSLENKAITSTINW